MNLLRNYSATDYTVYLEGGIPGIDLAFYALRYNSERIGHWSTRASILFYSR